jgi:hypothetical protein
LSRTFFYRIKMHYEMKYIMNKLNIFFPSFHRLLSVYIKTIPLNHPLAVPTHNESSVCKIIL